MSYRDDRYKVADAPDGVIVVGDLAGMGSVSVFPGQDNVTIWRGTAAEYAALGTYDDDTIYFATA